MTLASETSASPSLFPPHLIRDSHATMQHYATMQCIMSGGGLASVIPCHYAPTVDLRTASTSSLNGQCAFTHYDSNPKKKCHKKALFIAQNTQIELYSPMVIVGQKCPPLSP